MCLSVNIWASGAGCKDLKLNGKFYYTNADHTKMNVYFSPFLNENYPSFELCNVLESNNKVIKFHPTAGAFTAGRLGSLWEFECNDNLTNTFSSESFN